MPCGRHNGKLLLHFLFSVFIVFYLFLFFFFFTLKTLCDKIAHTTHGTTTKIVCVLCHTPAESMIKHANISVPNRINKALISLKSVQLNSGFATECILFLF